MQESRSIRKSLATAREGAEPSFDTVAQAASAALLCDLSVQVLCLTHDQLQRWLRYAEGLQEMRLKVQVCDLNRATLAEWQARFGQKRSDMTVLAGFHAARRRNEVSAHYATTVVDSIPEGLVVMA